MAEVAGLVASVISIASCGVKLSMGLREAVSEIRSAANHVHDIASSISLFSHTIRHVGNCIKAQSHLHSEVALETLAEIITHCRAIFSTVESMLEEFLDSETSERPRLNIHRRVKFVFKKSTIHYLMARLESSKLTLSIMLQVFQLKAVIDRPDGYSSEYKAQQSEIAMLREEIRSLVLDQYWARQKEGIALGTDDSIRFTKQDHTPSGVPQQAPPGTKNPKPDTHPDMDVKSKETRALVLYGAKPPTGSDRHHEVSKDLYDAVSPTTLADSKTAVDSLLAWWCASDDVDNAHNRQFRSLDWTATFLPSRYNADTNSWPKSEVRPGPSQSNDRYSSNRVLNHGGPSYNPDGPNFHETGRGETPASRSDDAWSYWGSGAPIVPTKKAGHAKAFNHRLSSKDKHYFSNPVPVALLWRYEEGSIVAVPSKYIAKFPNIKWSTTKQDYAQKLRSRWDYCWRIYDGPFILHFIDDCCVACKYQSGGLDIPVGTCLPDAWFAKEVVTDFCLESPGREYTTQTDMESLHRELTVVEKYADQEVRAGGWYIRDHLELEDVRYLYEESRKISRQSRASPQMSLEQHLLHLRYLRRLGAPRSRMKGSELQPSES